jgi:hypothetical protein
MRYVILRDDDTNALTPPECLERLYRPFLRRALPVNLATIPEVDVDTRTANGELEGYLLGSKGAKTGWLDIGSNAELMDYLRENHGYHLIQHGCHHDAMEFNGLDGREAARRLELGSRKLMEAGFPRPETFVAPYDKLSRASFAEAAKRFQVISTGWFELGRLPRSWWPRYLLKKMRRVEHWQVGGTRLLSHPGCLLSCHRPCHQMLDAVRACVARRRLTVLATHWWEYFPGGRPNELFIEVLHAAADYLAGEPDLKVISFADLAARRDISV